MVQKHKETEKKYPDLSPSPHFDRLAPSGSQWYFTAISLLGSQSRVEGADIGWGRDCKDPKQSKK